jgi:hypothetical protein
VTARNLVASVAREEKRRRGHEHRLIDLREPVQPEQEALRREEEAAVATALSLLSARDRDAVIGHEVMGKDTTTLAAELRSTPGSVAVQLARARAKLRVDYLLALRRSQPPPSICRPVLIARSSGDRRRQAALGAGRHLLACAHCASLSESLLHRRRTLSALLPLASLIKLREGLGRLLRSPKGQAGVAATGIATAAVIAAAAVGGGGRSSPPPRSALSIRGNPVQPQAVAEVGRHNGQIVRADRVEVRAVPSDEGFWVGSAKDNRVWVQLTLDKGESRVTIEPRQRLSFTGRIVTHGPRFPRRVGVSQQEGGLELSRARQHIEVREASITLK